MSHPDRGIEPALRKIGQTGGHRETEPYFWVALEKGRYQQYIDLIDQPGLLWGARFGDRIFRSPAEQAGGSGFDQRCLRPRNTAAGLRHRPPVDPFEILAQSGRSDWYRGNSLLAGTAHPGTGCGLPLCRCRSESPGSLKRYQPCGHALSLEALAADMEPAQHLGLHRDEGGNGGERGIRTLETVSRLHTFQACAFDHSATSPARARNHFPASCASPQNTHGHISAADPQWQRV